MNKIWLIALGCLVLLMAAKEKEKNTNSGFRSNQLWNVTPQFLEVDTRWVDSVLSKMSDREKIGQLFMVAAYSNRDIKHQEEIFQLIKNYSIGGLIFFQGGPVRQAQLTNIYQKESKVPLMIGMDAEWGLAMRLDSVVKYPKQMTLGAIQNDTLIYLMGRMIGKECRRMGVHINFAPVVDVNSNPENPVINFRSFGENKNNVARKSFAYMLGLQDEFILACAKHFPGHGDTDSDSHLTLPKVDRTKRQIDSVELFPFRFLMKSGLASVMVAHLEVPALEKQNSLPASLSKKIVSDLLKNDMNFKGLVFTDALNMKGVSEQNTPGITDMKALIAGNDVLLFPEDIPKAVEEIEKAVEKGMISMDEIEKRCRKILMAKKWVGLDKKNTVSTDNLIPDLNNPYALALNHKLFENSLTVLENRSNILPLKRLDTVKIALISIGDTLNNSFQKSLERYSDITSFSISADPSGSELGALYRKIKEFNLFIIGLNATTNSPAKNFGLNNSAIALINDLNTKHRVIVSLFGNAYGLSKFPGASLLDGLIVAYENHETTKDITAQFIFGAASANGLLPVKASKYFGLNDGLCINEINRLSYCLPEYLGISSNDLNQIDSLALNGIKEKAYPGCQILIAKKGKVFYYKSFGYYTYDNKQAVTNNTIYDLASVTKIASTVSALMYLQDQKQFQLDLNLKKLLPEIPDSNEYSSLVARKMLAHEAGLTPWIPFYYNTMKKGELMNEHYRKSPVDSFRTRVAEGIYIRDTYKDSILTTILKTPLLKSKKYLYSDVSYYFFQEFIQRTTKTSLDHFTDSVFYKPLGATTLGYLPRKRFSLNSITPQEDDKIFRKQLIQGDVHDQGAAMLGGVAGHAGLFSNANDLAKMMQMLMNYGEYGGERYLKKETVLEYTSCQFCPTNRRGAGFDRPTMSDGLGPTCNCVSSASFGHTGFTGITAWADPGEDVIYIFMSNRSYPIGDNPKILKMGIRTDIQQVIYKAIRKSRL